MYVCCECVNKNYVTLTSLELLITLNSACRDMQLWECKGYVYGRQLKQVHRIHTRIESGCPASVATWSVPDGVYQTPCLMKFESLDQYPLQR